MPASGRTDHTEASAAAAMTAPKPAVSGLHRIRPAAASAMSMASTAVCTRSRLAACLPPSLIASLNTAATTPAAAAPCHTLTPAVASGQRDADRTAGLIARPP